MTSCIVCDANLSVDERTQVNEIIVCSDCGTELEITGLNPVSVTAAPQEQEDWGE